MTKLQFLLSLHEKLAKFPQHIFVETDTGDVTGTLLSEKVFLAQTDTGHIDTPQTTNGGVCEITTDTGNIRITVE